MDRDLAPAILAFDLDAYMGKLADVELLRGDGGWLAAARLTLDTPAKRYDDLIVVALTDDGGVVPRETAERLMMVPATARQADGAAPPPNLDGLIADAQTALVGAAQTHLGDFLDEEENHAALEQIEPRPPVALALDELEAVDLAFPLAAAPGLSEGGSDRSAIAVLLLP